MKKFIVSRYSFKEEDIKVLKDDLWLTKEFQPTKANIVCVLNVPLLGLFLTMPFARPQLAAMDWLVSGVQPNDSLFFHYSGHGGQVEDTSGDEADYQDECIYPIDSVALTGASAEGSEARTANIIIDDLLYTTLVRPLPTGARLTAIFDSCHSGSVLDLPFAYAAGSGRVKHQGLEGMHLNVEGLAERPKLYRGHEEHSEKVRKAEEGVFKVKGIMADAKEIISGSGRKIFQEKDTKGAISDLGKLLEVKQHIRGVEEMRKVSEIWADVVCSAASILRVGFDRVFSDPDIRLQGQAGQRGRGSRGYTDWRVELGIDQCTRCAPVISLPSRVLDALAIQQKPPRSPPISIY